jgi:hypothetical protein
MLGEDLERALALKLGHYVPDPGNKVSVQAKHARPKEVPADEYLSWL